HLYKFVVFNVGKGPLERDAHGRRQDHVLVLACGTDVGELLALDDVDDEVVVACVLAHDHALIDASLWLDDHRPAALRVEERTGGGPASAMGDAPASLAPGDLAFVWYPAVEQAVHHGGAARIGQELALVADETPRRRVEHEPQAATAGGAHLLELAAPLCQLLHDNARVLRIDIDDYFLYGFQPPAAGGIDLQHHARTRDGELEALSTHRLDQDAELQFTASGHFVGILAVLVLSDADSDVALGFPQQPIADDTALELVALLSCERTVVDAEQHSERRRVDRLCRQRRLHRRIAKCVGDRGLRNAGNGHDVAGLG